MADEDVLLVVGLTELVGLDELGLEAHEGLGEEAVSALNELGRRSQQHHLWNRRGTAKGPGLSQLGTHLPRTAVVGPVDGVRDVGLVRRPRHVAERGSQVGEVPAHVAGVEPVVERVAVGPPRAGPVVRHVVGRRRLRRLHGDQRVDELVARDGRGRRGGVPGQTGGQDGADEPHLSNREMAMRAGPVLPWIFLGWDEQNERVWSLKVRDRIQAGCGLLLVLTGSLGGRRSYYNMLDARASCFHVPVHSIVAMAVSYSSMTSGRSKRPQRAAFAPAARLDSLANKWLLQGLQMAEQDA